MNTQRIYVIDTPPLAVITGDERFKVTDLSSDTQSFFDNQHDAYKTAIFIANVKGHRYQIEDRKEHWYSVGGNASVL